MTSFDIYVINLDKDTERLHQINEYLTPNSFVRISGVLGKEIDVHDYPEIFYLSKYLAPKSAIGCALSHRKAVQYFIDNSEKEYALILEDDATPVFDNYMEEIELAIQNGPKDWDIIKLDYWPDYKTNTYNNYPSMLTTCYIINKKGAKKLLDHKIINHIDFDILFMDLNVYNYPVILFEQIWDKNYVSNNRENETSNPFSTIYLGLNHKFIRLFDYEVSFADLFLFLFILLIMMLVYLFFSITMKKKRYFPSIRR
jgi:GR25 family glycosyltransferase involved in LPS biosynthesis